MYNHTGLQGRLTADPELRYTQQGTAITSFTLASDTGRKTKDGKKITNFIECVAWRAQAEFVCKYLSKGRLVLVEGELTSRNYPRETEKCLFVMCGVEGFNNNKDHFNDAYEAILDYMVGEAQKVGLKAKQLTEITGVQMWGHWFSKSQFTPIPEWHYKKLQQAFKGRAFSLPHDQVMKLRNKPSEAYQSMKAEAMELRAFFDNTHNDSDEHDIMTDVWRFPITNTAERDDAGGHATPKPIALCERAILSSSRPGELVVDFFGGSGSTLIACENTGRTCAMIELEPKWCDVIVRRYIKTTGDNNVRCVRQGRELPREEIAAIFEPDEEGGEQE